MTDKKVLFALGLLVFGGAAGCTTEADIRATGAQKVSVALANIRVLYDNLRTGSANGTAAQNAMIEVAKLPGGLAAMLLKPINIPAAQASKATAIASVSFPDCAPLMGEETGTQSVTLANCTAGPFTINGSGSRSPATTCGAGGKVYGGTVNAALDSSAATGTIALTLSNACVSSSQATGLASATVNLTVPGVPNTMMNLETKFDVTFGATGQPTSGRIGVRGAGIFVGGPIDGLVCAAIDTTGIRVSGTPRTCTTVDCACNHLN